MAVGITGTFVDTDYNRQADDASAGRLRLLRGSKMVSEANENYKRCLEKSEHRFFVINPLNPLNSLNPLNPLNS